LVHLPNSIKEALALNTEKNNTLWEDAVLKEGIGTRIAFEARDDGKPLPGYKEVKLMMSFDIEMDFTLIQWAQYWDICSSLLNYHGMLAPAF
jgi:hypothetical protein